MNARTLIIATALSLISASASAQPALRVAVHPTSYAIGARSFDDIGKFAQAVRVASPNVVSLNACGPAAGPALLAAAAELSSFPLDLQMLSAKSPVCTAGVITPTAVTQGPRGIDRARVQHYWQQVSP